MTMRARLVMIWLGVVLLGVPVAIIVFDDISILTDNAAVVAGVLLILSLTVTGWRLKRRLKERMKRGLGRDVDDIELTSITAWMRIPDEAARAGRDAEKYDFD
jgi:uncharacterized membrane protein YqjE